MKKILFLILFLLSSSPAFATDWCADANCQACYLMQTDEDPLSDSSGNGNTADLKADGEPNYSTSAPAGYPNGSYVFDGTDDKAVDGAPTTVTSGFAVTAWSYKTAGWQTFLYYNGTDGGGWGLGIDGTNLKCLYGGVAWLDFNKSIAEDAWHHAAMSDRSGTVYGYVDGVESATTFTKTPNAPRASTSTIGSEESSRYYTGNITQIGVFDTGLSSTDINDIMDNGLSPAATGRTRRFF